MERNRQINTTKIVVFKIGCNSFVMFALSSQCRVRLPALSTALIFRWINVDKSVDKLWVFIAVAGHPAITWNVGVCRQPAGIAVDGAIQLGRISMAFMQRWHDGRYE